jgi:hypothetical protein
MANVFESSRAASAALELILQRFIGKLSRRTGAGPGRLDDDGIKTLSVMLPAQADDLARLVTECRQALALPDDPDQALKLAAQLAAISAGLNFARPYPKSRNRSYSREAGYE